LFVSSIFGLDELFHCRFEHIEFIYLFMLPAPKKRDPARDSIYSDNDLNSEAKRERYRRSRRKEPDVLVVIHLVIIKYLSKPNGQAEQLFNLSTQPRVAPPSRCEQLFFCRHRESNFYLHRFACSSDRRSRGA
jgi:hypothetical protein